jgi:hypothetical protein
MQHKVLFYCLQPFFCLRDKLFIEFASILFSSLSFASIQNISFHIPRVSSAFLFWVSRWKMFCGCGCGKVMWKCNIFAVLGFHLLEIATKSFRSFAKKNLLSTRNWYQWQMFPSNVFHPTIPIMQICKFNFPIHISPSFPKANKIGFPAFICGIKYKLCGIHSVSLEWLKCAAPLHKVTEP